MPEYIFFNPANMKSYFLLIFSALWAFSSNAQCPIAPLLLSTQADVDNFPTNFPGCTDLAVGLTVTGNNIVNLDGLNGILTTANSLIIRDNPILASLNGLSSLTSIAVELKIDNNDALTSLSGLDNLAFLGGHLSIEGNAVLATLDGMGPIPSLGSYLNVSFNPVLTDITALSTIQEVGPNYINGFLAINNNNSLTSVNGLDLITECGSYFFLGSNPVMTTINGLNGLTTVNGDFEVAGNAVLNDLNAFTSLTTVDGTFNIDNNPALTNLSEFGNLTTVGGDLTIATNASLTDCAAQGICDYLSGPGFAIIANNGNGCNSVAQVEAACLLLPVELEFFNARKNDEGVLLIWETASEKNNSHFEVEHNTPGNQSFKTIGKVPGHGTTYSNNDYKLVDKFPSQGLNYYRLKQVDSDGKFQYSNIVSVFIENIDDIGIFPNPTTGPVEIKGVAQDRTARVTDIAGHEILTKDLTESSLIDLSGQPGGVYLIEIQTNRQKVVKRVVRK